MTKGGKRKKGSSSNMEGMDEEDEERRPNGSSSGGNGGGRKGGKKFGGGVTGNTPIGNAGANARNTFDQNKAKGVVDVAALFLDVATSTVSKVIQGVTLGTIKIPVSTYQPFTATATAPYKGPLPYGPIAPKGKVHITNKSKVTK